MVPDRLNIDKAIIQTFIVSPTLRVRPGFPVKLSTTQANPNIYEIVECTAPTDIPIGLAVGVVGDPDGYAFGGPSVGLYPTTAKIQVLCYFHVVERAIAGSTGVSLGNKVVVEASTSALVAGPASNPAGATLNWCHGVALATVQPTEAFPLAVLPHTYVST